jgi:arginine decarboxylase
MVPKKVFFTKGVGIHKERLASFELAMRFAGVAHCNLVLVSSIYPPGCKIISKEEGLKLLRPGEIVFAVYDRESNNEPNRLVAASVGLAIPTDSSMHGYLSEHHSFGETDERAGEYAEDLAASMLATTLGIEFDPALDWDKREHLFKMSGKIVRTSNITQSAVGNKDGLWTTVFAAAVFINDDNVSAEIAKSQENAVVDIQDEASKQASRNPFAPSELREAMARRNNIRLPYEPRPVVPNHGQQEVTKALHRALRAKETPSPHEKGPVTIGESSAAKIGRLKFPKPL